MNANYPGWNATEQATCPECGSFVDESKRHQACPHPDCGTAVFIMNGEVVDREARPGTQA
jgi:ribosomal protein S27AE